MVKFERLSGLWNYRLSRPTGTLFYIFFSKSKKTWLFTSFLSCLTRFLEHWYQSVRFWWQTLFSFVVQIDADEFSPKLSLLHFGTRVTWLSEANAVVDIVNGCLILFLSDDSMRGRAAPAGAEMRLLIAVGRRVTTPPRTPAWLRSSPPANCPSLRSTLWRRRRAVPASSTSTVPAEWRRWWWLPCRRLQRLRRPRRRWWKAVLTRLWTTTSSSNRPPSSQTSSLRGLPPRIARTSPVRRRVFVPPPPLLGGPFPWSIMFYVVCLSV